MDQNIGGTSPGFWSFLVFVQATVDFQHSWCAFGNQPYDVERNRLNIYVYVFLSYDIVHYFWILYVFSKHVYMTNLSNIVSVCWFWYVYIYTCFEPSFAFSLHDLYQAFGLKTKRTVGRRMLHKAAFRRGMVGPRRHLPYTLGFFMKSPIAIFLKENRRMEYHKDTWMSQEVSKR